MIANKTIEVSKFGNGFYQTGVENDLETPETAWLIHGEIGNTQPTFVIAKFKELLSFMFHKFEIAKYHIGLRFLNDKKDKFIEQYFLLAYQWYAQ